MRMRLFLVTFVVASCVVALAPAVALAQDARQSRADIRILSDADFTAANGVRSGAGTAEDPFVISGWNVSNLYLKDTGAHVVIHDNRVRSRLTLDWNGPGLHVHHNEIGDLRVNQNVPRTGAATSGVISDNVIGSVGQIRHWDGVFENNVVGLPPGTSPAQDAFERFLAVRAVNFDGFNGARFRNNTIYGYVDVRLHGHHHSSEFGDGSHHHSMDDDMDHSSRYHQVWVTGNRIEVSPSSRYALMYVDTNHAANDRTANSERNPALNDPHIHHTRVFLNDNDLVGAGLYVNVFNANDQRHIDTSRGVVTIDRNRIRLRQDGLPWWDAKDGIIVSDVRDVDMYIRDNMIEADHRYPDPQGLFTRFDGYGMWLSRVDKARVRIYDNHIANRYVGIQASSFSSTVDWFIDGLDTHHVEHVLSTSQVANAPGDRAADAEYKGEWGYGEDEPDDDTGHDPGHDH